MIKSKLIKSNNPKPVSCSLNLDCIGVTIELKSVSNRVDSEIVKHRVHKLEKSLCAILPNCVFALAIHRVHIIELAVDNLQFIHQNN